MKFAATLGEIQVLGNSVGVTGEILVAMSVLKPDFTDQKGEDGFVLP